MNLYMGHHYFTPERKTRLLIANVNLTVHTNYNSILGESLLEQRYALKSVCVASSRHC